MRSEAPRRLHWVQVRDAVALLDWRRGRLTGVAGDVAAVVALDAGGADGPECALTCERPDAVAQAAAGGVAHARGGHVVLWTARGRMLAVPLADRCTVGAEALEIDPRAVILEVPPTAGTKREFELLAEDSTWTARLFAATDKVALQAAADDAATRAVARPDRSSQFRKLRSSLRPEL